MNIVYYSSIFFSDCDFPLIKTMQERGDNVLYIIELVNGKTKGGLLKIESKLPNHGIVRADNIKEFKMYAEYIDLNNIYVITRTPRLFDPHNWFTYLKLCRMIRNFNPKVVHSTVILGLSESLLYLFRNKMVLTVHDPFVHSGETSKSLELKRKAAFGLIHKLILLNQKQLSSFVETYRINPKSVFVNSLGVYDCLNFVSSKQKTLKNRRGEYILFFGHISPYKGIDVLCEAMKEVHLALPNMKCIIAGNGRLYFDFEPYKSLGYICLENRYIETAELANLISNSLFVVCPYKDATQSGVVFSSFALSKAIIATNVGGLGESVIDGETGFLIQPNNVQALSQAIISLCKDNQLRCRLEQNITNKYKEGDLSWRAIAERYVKCYNS